MMKRYFGLAIVPYHCYYNFCLSALSLLFVALRSRNTILLAKVVSCYLAIFDRIVNIFLCYSYITQTILDAISILIAALVF